MGTIEKPFIFVTGPPRAGTSLITKVIDSHPDAAILMENNFGNRRRHWKRPAFWNSPEGLSKVVEEVYSTLPQPVVGNKICTPDVWSDEDIALFCRLFQSFRIVFVIRHPAATAMSRHKRENHPQSFTSEARKHMLLDFSSTWRTYVSSWRQSIETYWKFKDAYPERVILMYYEDFCNAFERHCRMLLDFLELPFSSRVLAWHRLPHHNNQGEFQKDLKYPDMPVFVRPLPEESIPAGLSEALQRVRWQLSCWEKREI
jgi:hypothetical protein